ncbi:MAG: hypothetical protein RL596_725 [Bacteroidota bacterium]|jgi:Tfp pilus assembly protein PilN
MKKILLLALVTLVFTQTNVSAQRGRNQLLKAKYDSLSPEQKKQFHDRMKEKRDSASPEQRKEMRKKMKDRYDQLSPEEQQQWKEKMKHRSDSLGVKPGRMHRKGLR